MRKLEPLRAPKFSSKHVRRGAAGVCYPEPKTKMEVVKKKAAK